MTSYLDQAELGAERCDIAFEQEEADRRRDSFDEFNRQRLQDARTARRDQSLDDRLAAVLHAIAWAPGRRAGNITQSARSTDAVSLPSLQDIAYGELGHFPADEVRRRLEAVYAATDRDVAARHIEALELAADVGRGWATAEDFSGLHTEDLDRRIIEVYEGFTPEEVSELEPSLGKAKAIRWARRRRGHDSETGAVRVSLADR